MGKGLQGIAYAFIVWFTGHCCSFVIPPVTITGNKTAIEKQIIGESAELEKDVWMISSAKTTAKTDIDLKPAEIRKKIQEENANIYRAFIIFDTFAPKLQQLKKDRVVGEGNQGLVVDLLKEKSIKFDEKTLLKYSSLSKNHNEDKMTLIKTVEQINIARKLAAKGYIENQKRVDKDFKQTEKSILLEQKIKYHEAALLGDYLQKEDGSWVQKR